MPNARPKPASPITITAPTIIKIPITTITPLILANTLLCDSHNDLKFGQY